MENTLHCHTFALCKLYICKDTHFISYSQIAYLTQIKVLSGYAFDNAKIEVFRSLERIKRENHIDNRPAIEKKIRLILENLHSNRNSKFDNFSYAGKRLSEYTTHEWVNKIADIMLCEIYDEAGYNNGRAANNIELAYEEIKVEFYKNLKK